MSYLAKPLRSAAFAMLLAATSANAQNPSSTPSPDQRPRPCGGNTYVGGQAANPFAAKRTNRRRPSLSRATNCTRDMESFNPPATKKKWSCTHAKADR